MQQPGIKTKKLITEKTNIQIRTMIKSLKKYWKKERKIDTPENSGEFNLFIDLISSTKNGRQNLRHSKLKYYNPAFNINSRKR